MNLNLRDSLSGPNTILGQPPPPRRKLVDGVGEGAFLRRSLESVSESHPVLVTSSS